MPAAFILWVFSFTCVKQSTCKPQGTTLVSNVNYCSLENFIFYAPFAFCSARKAFAHRAEVPLLTARQPTWRVAKRLLTMRHLSLHESKRLLFRGIEGVPATQESKQVGHGESYLGEKSRCPQTPLNPAGNEGSVFVQQSSSGPHHGSLWQARTAAAGADHVAGITKMHGAAPLLVH
jgi:hypothetical protein